MANFVVDIKKSGEITGQNFAKKFLEGIGTPENLDESKYVSVTAEDGRCTGCRSLQGDDELISKLISDKIVYTKESPNNSSGWRLTIGQNGQPDLVPTLLGDSFGGKKRVVLAEYPKMTLLLRPKRLQAIPFLPAKVRIILETAKKMRNFLSKTI